MQSVLWQNAAAYTTLYIAITLNIDADMLIRERHGHGQSQAFLKEFPIALTVVSTTR